MRTFHKFISAAALLFVLDACAVGGGRGFDEDTGLAALSLRLHGMEEGEIYLTRDGYRLRFEHFALAFSSVSLGGFESQGAFGADFFDEEVADLVEIEGIPAGEYDSVSLTLGLGEGESAQHFLFATGMKRAETLPPDLQGLSVFLEAEAVSGSQTCILQVALTNEGEVLDVDSEGSHVEVEAGKEAEISVEVDPNTVFAGVDLGGLCQGGALLKISSTENSAMAAEISANLTESFLLGSTQGHHHH